jgi:hypothetical protein
MHDLWHGRIEHLPVVGGVPRMVHRTKLLARYRDGCPEPRSRDRPNFLKCRPHPQHSKLWEDCRKMGEGVICRLEVADGIPIYWESSQPTSRATA